jgi:hypothetical protein
MDPKIARSSYLPWTLVPASLNVYDAKTWSFPVFYGRDVALAYNLGTVFVQKGTNIVITFNPNLQRATRDLIILSNSTNDNPEGYGYSVNEPLIIYNTLYHAVKDMHYLCVNRYSSLKEKNIRNVAAEVFIEQAESYISKAEDYLKNKIYDKFYDTCLVALALTSRAYDESVMPLFDELSRFLLFFTIPMLLFAIFFERFIFHMQKMKRIIGIAIILILLILTLNYVNPIFKLMANSIMAFFGTSLILLAVVIITIFIKEAIDIMESTVVRLLGEHEVKTEKVSALLYSLGVAVDNMRRRPLTTILTLMTIITFNAAITTFTSASVVVSVLETPPKTVQIPYNGLLLKKDYAIPPDVRGGVLDLPLISYMKGIAGEGYYIVPRVWYYPLSIYPYGPSLVIVSKGVSYIISPSALLGLSSEESALLFDKYIINGSATLFSLRGCIISNNLAKMLNVKVGEQIELKGTGINFTITGIVETFGERLTDFDSRSILPIDPFYSSTLARMSIPYSETLEPQPLSLDNVIIVYWKTAYELGGYVSSVSLIPKSNITFEDLKDVGRRAALGNDVIFYAGYNNSVVSFYRTTTYLTFGWEVLIVLIAISSLSIFNTLIGNIERRKPEIRIFASLGLSPLGAGIMFIAESLAYAVLASVIGYLIGYAMNIILTRFMLIGFPLNASSLFITISLLVVLITCLGSSIYPFIVASKLITPSLERKWKLATKPHGDYWAISLPVSFPTREIGYGLLAFLEEYYTGMGAVRPGFMVRGISPFNASEESIMLEITLTPAELNLNMTVTFKVIPHGNTFSLEMLMERKSGDYKQWIIRSYYFIDSVRKQILVWGTLSEGEKLIYINKNKE